MASTTVTNKTNSAAKAVRSMNTVCKVQRGGVITIPAWIRLLAGLRTGDLVRMVFQRGKIVITPLHK